MGVHQLPAAHWIELPLRGRPATPVRYWAPELGEPSNLSLTQAAARLRDLFLESVRLHLRSDVPIGVALSGSIDSASIALAVRALQGGGQELHTFSCIADDQHRSEEAWVDLVGASARSVVHKVRASGEGLAADVERLIRAQGEPFGSTSIYAQYRVFDEARAAGMKVMLNGQGADELLAGDRGYYAARLASLLRQQRWGDSVAFFKRAVRVARVRQEVARRAYRRPLGARSLAGASAPPGRP